MDKISGFDGEYRWLSNFWPAPVVYEGIAYPTTEHAYQAAKVTDENLRKQVSLLPTPGKAKRFFKGKPIRSDWDQIKLQVMEDLLRQKFQNPYLKAKLLSTGNIEIEETNTWGDVFWGICKGVGENHLGKILMKIRSEL